MNEIWEHLPQQWVGICALVMFVIYVVGQAAEKYPAIAKVIPLGRWWHNRQRSRHRRSEWVAEDNEVIVALKEQVGSIANDLGELQQAVRCFQAWSIYDARWHHRTNVINTKNESCLLPRHYDFFEFEKLWKNDPLAAAALPVAA